MTTKPSAVCAAALVAAFAGMAALPGAGLAQRRPSVARIEVVPGDQAIAVGATANFLATAYDNANNALDVNVVWTSSNLRAATIDRETGIATGVAPGTTIITASYGRGRSVVREQATLTVTAAGAAPQPQANPSTPTPPAVVAAQPGGVGRRTGPGCAALERQPPGTGVADGLAISPQRMPLIKGESMPLVYYTVRGADGGHAEPVCIVFGVDAGGDRVAQVDSFGVVTAGDTGRAMVRATGQGGVRWAPKQIAVDVHADSVRFSVRERSLSPQTVDTLALIVPAQNNRRLDPARTNFQFASSDTTKVRVSVVAPIVTAVAPGTARITATNPSYPDIFVTVNVRKPVRYLVGTPAADSVALAIGARVTLGARFLAADSTPVDNLPIRWTLPDSAIAAFDTATKTARGVKMGNTRITVSAMMDHADSIWRHWYLRVIAGGLQVATPRFALPVGEQMPLAVQLLDDHRRPVGPAPGLAWRSSADSIARVADGRAIAVAMGHAQLQARASWDSVATADAYVVGDLLVPARRGGRWDLLMVQRSDPPKWSPVTADSLLEMQAAWSPDWTRIAYVATPPRPEQFDLYVANADGSDARRLTHDSVPVHSPAFVGPGGDQIVFEAGRSGRTQLFIINRDGTGRRQITTGANPSTQPAVSPDGRRVLFVSLRGGNYNIYQMNLDGTGEQRLTTGRVEDSPAFAADGKSFYYLLGSVSPPGKAVYNQDLTTSEATQITPAGVYVQAFSVSTDGRTLAIVVVPPDQTHDAPHAEFFDRLTQLRTRFVLPGVDGMGGPAFRPAAPQVPPAQH